MSCNTFVGGVMKSTWDPLAIRSSLAKIKDLLYEGVSVHRQMQLWNQLIEAYHLYDRLGKRIPHEERFSIPRIPALVKLRVQAGVDLPEFPTKRRRKRVIRIGKHEFVNADESELPDPEPEAPETPLLTKLPIESLLSPLNAEETALLAEETLQSW